MYIMGVGTVEAPRGVTKKPVEFLLGRGTKNPTCAYVKVVVSYSTHYFVLIGMDLLAMVGATVDTWHRKLTFRPDWDIGSHRVANLPIKLTRKEPHQFLACQSYGGLVDTLEDVLGVEDLPKEEPKVVGVIMPMGKHLELMEAAQVEMEVHKEA